MLVVGIDAELTHWLLSENSINFLMRLKRDQNRLGRSDAAPADRALGQSVRPRLQVDS